MSFKKREGEYISTIFKGTVKEFCYQMIEDLPTICVPSCLFHRTNCGLIGGSKDREKNCSEYKYCGICPNVTRTCILTGKSTDDSIPKCTKEDFTRYIIKEY